MHESKRFEQNNSFYCVKCFQCCLVRRLICQLYFLIVTNVSYTLKILFFYTFRRPVKIVGRLQSN